MTRKSEAVAALLLVLASAGCKPTPHDDCGAKTGDGICVDNAINNSNAADSNAP